MHRTLRQLCTLGLAAVTVAGLLTACGGSNDDYRRIVVFGDSLSDVGTYATPGVTQTFGGGKYTINGPTSKIWVEDLAGRVGVAAPCAAQTGLESSGQLEGLAAPITDVADCFGFAQGGARVTNPVGPANKALLGLGVADGALGQLTKPLVDQVARHNARHQFSGLDLVTVLAGGNDVFMNLAALEATAAQNGGDVNAAATTAVAAMGTAGTELAALIRTEIIGKGARRVVVVTLPDITKTPFGLSLQPGLQSIVASMVSTFNDQLQTGLQATAGVLVVDGYARSRSIADAPQSFGVSNATTPACDLTRAVLGSLSCTAATTVQADVSGFQYADGVHPTPLGYRLITDSVVERMRAVGWL
jgi:outer membrane lipase/esterase